MLRCQYCGRVIHGRAADLKTHIRKQHPEHAGVAPVPTPERREQLSPWKLGGLSITELSKRVWNSINNDDVINRAAELAYFFFFSLFPALILLTAVFGLLAGPGTKLHDMLLQYMGTALPGSAFEMVKKVLDETSQAAGGGKITFGILLSLWSASAAMTAVQDTLNAVYDVPEGRPWWKAKGIAIGLTVVCSILMILALVIILSGGMLADFVGNHLGLTTAFTWTWKIVQWPIALVLPGTGFLRYLLLRARRRTTSLGVADPGSAGGHGDMDHRFGRTADLSPLLQLVLRDLRFAGGRHYSAHVVLRYRPDAAVGRGGERGDRECGGEKWHP